MAPTRRRTHSSLMRVMLGALLVVGVAPGLGAQTIRGIVVEDSTDRPIDEAVLSLIGADGMAIEPSVRSAVTGAFTLHAPRFGTFRVRAVRIGYQPVTTEPFDVATAEL